MTVPRSLDTLHSWLFVRCLLILALALATLVLPFMPLSGAQEEASTSPAPTGMHQVKRVCVEDFEGGENARQLRAMLIDQLRRMGLVVITENPDRADALLRGFAEDLVFTEQHIREENVGARSQGAVATGGYTRNRRAVSSASAVNDSVRQRSTERRHEAALTVRIVNLEGDVLWSASAESRGGKYRSAAAEVSTRIAEDLRKTLQSAPGSTVSPDARDSADSPASSRPAPD